MILFDMDGTLAKFYYDKNYLEKMYEPGYFLNLKPYKLVEYARKLIIDGYDIGILSACVNSSYCRQEKSIWLERYIPELNRENIFFCDVGLNKAEYIDWEIGNTISPQEHMILIDDYSKNLCEWNMFNPTNYIPIKFLNGINNKSGFNYQYKFRTGKQLQYILDIILKDTNVGDK